MFNSKSLLCAAVVCLALTLAGGVANADVTVKINPVNSVTTCVDHSTTFSCTVQPSNCEPSDKATKSYQWSVDGVLDPNGTGSSYTYSSTTPGTHTVSCSASIKDTTVNPVEDCGTASDHSLANIIGGPITGAADVNYFCSDAPPGSLSGASGQPLGTTFAWSMSGTATLLDPNMPISTWTKISATFRGTDGSTAGGVTATLAYSLNGVTCKSTYAITVHKPTVLHFASATAPHTYYPDDPAGNTLWYGFDNYDVKYQIFDQFGHFMPSISWNEQWLGMHHLPGSDPNAEGPSSEGGGATAQGIITDYHHVINYDQTPPLNLVRPNGVNILMFDTHKFFVGSMSDGLGCLLLTHNNVTFSTTGVTNDQ